MSIRSWLWLALTGIFLILAPSLVGSDRWASPLQGPHSLPTIDRQDGYGWSYQNGFIGLGAIDFHIQQKWQERQRLHGSQLGMRFPVPACALHGGGHNEIPDLSPGALDSRLVGEYARLGEFPTIHNDKRPTVFPCCEEIGKSLPFEFGIQVRGRGLHVSYYFSHLGSIRSVEMNDPFYKRSGFSGKHCGGDSEEIEINRRVSADSGGDKEVFSSLSDFAYLRGRGHVCAFRPSGLTVSTEVNCVRPKVCKKTRGNGRLSGAAQKEEPQYWRNNSGAAADYFWDRKSGEVYSRAKDIDVSYDGKQWFHLFGKKCVKASAPFLSKASHQCSEAKSKK